MKRKRVYGSKYDHMLSDIQANKSAVKSDREIQEVYEYLTGGIDMEKMLKETFNQIYPSLSSWVKMEDPFLTGVPFTPPPCPNVEKVKQLIDETEL